VASGGAGATTVAVSNAAAIASTPGQYYIEIDGEEMEVTNVNLSTNVLTVMRHVNGVTASHIQATDPVYLFTDQRGITRTIPHDIGAYQSQFVSKLIFVVQPSDVMVGKPMTVTVQLTDSFGDAVQEAGVTVSMELKSGSGLGGTLSTTTNAKGQAVFSDLTFSNAGTFQLLAMEDGLTQASQMFSVTKYYVM